MVDPYSSRFWKENWDPRINDLNPIEFDTNFIEITKPIFEEFSDKMALEYFGLEDTFGELYKYSK